MNRTLSRVGRIVAPLFFKSGQIFSLEKGELAHIKVRVQDPKEAMYFRIHGPTWEQDHFDFIKRLRKGGLIPDSDAVICDVGANIGLYSFWFDYFYKGHCVVHAFEPLPEAVERLRDGLKINGIEAVRVVAAAVADKTAEVEFFQGRHHSSGTIVQKAGVDSFKVKSISIDDYFLGAEPKPLPHFMKIDIEGGGVFALKGMLEVVRRSQPVILMDSHNLDEDRAIGEFLKQLDWQAYRLNTSTWVADKDATSPDSKGVWGTLLLCSNEAAEKVRRILA